MADRTHQQQRRLRSLILDGRFQLSYVVLVTGVCVTIAFALGLLIHQQATFASAQILVSLDRPGMDWVDPATREALKAQLSQTDTSFLISLVVIGLVLALVVAAALIAMTHHSAGPVHRMTQVFEAWSQGHLLAPGQLRRSDQFQSAFSNLRTAHVALVQRSREDLQAMTAFLETAGDELDGVAELRALVGEKQASSD